MIKLVIKKLFKHTNNEIFKNNTKISVEEEVKTRLVRRMKNCVMDKKCLVTS